MKVNMKTREIVYCAIFATITAVLAQISIPLPGGVPLTMQTFAVSLAGILLGSKRGFISMLVYVLMGCIGIPVFAGLTAGIGAVLGPTGGFILSFPIMSFIIGLITERTNNKIIIFLGMVLGSIVNYVVGAAQFAIVTDSTLLNAFLVCVLPFILVGLIKAVLATGIGSIIKNNKSFKRIISYEQA